MKQQCRIIGALLVLSLAHPSAHGTAAERKLTGKFAGSIVSTAIDVDNNGATSVLSTVRGKSSLGMTSSQTIGESAPQLPAVNTCPANNLEFPLLMAHSIIHFEDLGDLLFATYSSGVTCFDPTSGVFTTTGKGKFTSGTGTLSNATGSFEATWQGKGIVRDRMGHEFDYLTGQVSGTIITP